MTIYRFKSSVRKAMILKNAETQPAPVVKRALEKARKMRILQPYQKIGKRRRERIRKAVKAVRRR